MTNKKKVPVPYSESFHRDSQITLYNISNSVYYLKVSHVSQVLVADDILSIVSRHTASLRSTILPTKYTPLRISSKPLLKIGP